MKTYQNVLLAVAIVALVSAPLMMVKKRPGEEIFTGSDAQGQTMVRTIAPEYAPWAEPLMAPPSSEIESLLFALQAALGAGFIGYYLGSAVTRAKFKREKGEG